MDYRGCSNTDFGQPLVNLFMTSEMNISLCIRFLRGWISTHEYGK